MRKLRRFWYDYGPLVVLVGLVCLFVGIKFGVESYRCGVAGQSFSSPQYEGFTCMVDHEGQRVPLQIIRIDGE